MQNIFKLSRKFVLLAVLFSGLSFVIFTDTNTAGAAPCCSECDAAFQACIDNGGTSAECFQQTRSCYRWCYFDC